MSESILCLALAIFHEARGEPIRGQKMVAEVVLNRTKHPNYPNSVCSVVKQPRQFSWVNKNVSLSNPPKIIYTNVQAQKSWEQAKEIARSQLKNKTNYTNGAVYFNTTRLGVRYKTKTTPCRVGNHIFY